MAGENDNRPEAVRGSNPPESIDISEFRGSLPPSAPIPQVNSVVLPREVVMKQRMIKAAIVAAVSLLLAIIALISYRYYADWRMKNAVLAFAATGEFDDYESASSLTADDPELADRVNALAALLGYESKAPAKAAGARGGKATRSQIASDIYRALAKGELARAAALSQSLTPAGDYGQEYAALQAEVAYRTGHVDQAFGVANAALTQNPGAPRYAALAARAVLRLKGTAEAYQVLKQAEGTATTMAALQVDARAAKNPATIQKALDTLRADDESLAPVWIARAHASVARSALNAGYLKRAYDAAGRAEKTLTVFDEEVILTVADAYLTLGATKKASALMADLTTAYSTDATERARLFAWIKANEGAPAKALSLLATVPKTPKNQLLAARIAQQSGDDVAAKSGFGALVKTPTVAADALRQLARLALEKKNATEALAHVKAAKKHAPNDPRVLELEVQALVDSGQGSNAKTVVAELLKRLPNEPLSHIAAGRAALSTGKADAALKSFAQAITLSGKAVSEHEYTLAGQAALAARKNADARKNFAKAIALSRTHRPARLGAVRTELNAGEIGAAKAKLDALKEDEIRGRDVALLKATYHVANGDGATAWTPVLRDARRYRETTLWLELGELYLQAAQPRGAMQYFRYGLRAGEDEKIRARIGRAMAFALDDNADRASSELEEMLPLISDQQRARVATIEGLIALSKYDRKTALQKADASLKLWPDNGEALALKFAAGQRKKDILKRGTQTPYLPQPRLYYRLAISEGFTDKGCDYAERYRSRCRGKDVQRITSMYKRCRSR